MGASSSEYWLFVSRVGVSVQSSFGDRESCLGAGLCEPLCPHKLVLTDLLAQVAHGVRDFLKGRCSDIKLYCGPANLGVQDTLAIQDLVLALTFSKTLILSSPTRSAGEFLHVTYKRLRALVTQFQSFQYGILDFIGSGIRRRFCSLRPDRNCGICAQCGGTCHNFDGCGHHIGRYEPAISGALRTSGSASHIEFAFALAPTYRTGTVEALLAIVVAKPAS